MMWVPMLQGFGMGGGLIVAIGAQNAYVLSQGIRNHYPVLIATVCLVCDTMLISAGVGGVGEFMATGPLLPSLATWGGAIFLFIYGFKSMKSALQNHYLAVEDSRTAPLKTVFLTTLAVSLLNPHAYLDTVVLLGSVSSRYSGTSRICFGAGAMMASACWFFSLSLGARMLAPLFRNARAWKVLDILIGTVMWVISASLVHYGLSLT